MNKLIANASASGRNCSEAKQGTIASPKEIPDLGWKIRPVSRKLVLHVRTFE